MKFVISFKTPDAVDYAIKDALTYNQEDEEGLDQDEIDELRDKRESEFRKVADKFVSYGEYISVEFDTETQTATVLKKAYSNG